MFPVRCYTCNTVLAHLHETYQERTSKGTRPVDVLADLRVRRMCCRRMFLGYVDLTTYMLDYARTDVHLDDSGSELRKDVKFERTITTD